jgi:hypothetical protein
MELVSIKALTGAMQRPDLFSKSEGCSAAPRLHRTLAVDLFREAGKRSSNTGNGPGLWQLERIVMPMSGRSPPRLLAFPAASRRLGRQRDASWE